MLHSELVALEAPLHRGIDHFASLESALERGRLGQVLDGWDTSDPKYWKRRLLDDCLDEHHF